MVFSSEELPETEAKLTTKIETQPEIEIQGELLNFKLAEDRYKRKKIRKKKKKKVGKLNYP